MMMVMVMSTWMTLVSLAAVLTPAGGIARWSGEMTVSKREELRDEVLRAFRHAYGSYMAHACELLHRQVLVIVCWGSFKSNVPFSCTVAAPGGLEKTG